MRFRSSPFWSHLAIWRMLSIGIISSLWAPSAFSECATCTDTTTLTGRIAIIGKGKATVTVGDKIEELTSSKAWDGRSKAERITKDFELKDAPIGEDGCVTVTIEIEPEVEPPPGFFNLPMEAAFDIGNCQCMGTPLLWSGYYGPSRLWDPVLGAWTGGGDDMWNNASELSRTFKLRIREKEDPAFDPGSAGAPRPFPSGGPGAKPDVPPTPDSGSQTFSLGRHSGEPVGRAVFTGELDQPITISNFSQEIVTGKEPYVASVVDVGGTLRQFRSEEAIVTVTQLAGSPSPGVEVKIHAAAGAVSQPDGTYLPSGDPLAVHELTRVSATVGGATVEGIKFTRTKYGVTSVSEHYGDPAIGLPGGFERQHQNGNISDVTRTPIYAGMEVTGYTAETIDRRFNGSTTHEISKKVETFEKFPWGMEVVEAEEDPSGTSKTTSYVYYDDVPSSSPHYGRLHVRYSSDGSWERYVYDSDGALKAIHRPWLTSPANAAGVVALPAEQCQVTEVLDERTMDTLTSQKTQVEKVVGRIVSTRVSSDMLNLSPVGDSALELRSHTYLGDGTLAQTNRFGYEYTGDSNGVARGKTLYSISPDGSLRHYEHSVGAPGPGETLSRQTTIATQGTEEQPYGIPRQHTRTVTITNSEGLIESRNEVALGGEDNFVLLSKQTIERDVTPQIQERTYQDGILVSTTTRLSATTTETVNETGLVSQTITNATTGDVVSTIQKGMTMSNHTGEDLHTTTSRSGLTETFYVHNGTPGLTESSRTYDKLGRVVASSEKAGSHARTYTYTLDGNGQRSEKEWHASVTNPIRVSTYYPNGQLKSVTGEAAVGTYYTYGIEFATGLQMTTVYQGSANSPRWTRSYSDALGRVVREEHPAPAGQGVITVSHYYNAKGQRTKSVSSTRPNAPTLFEYNEAGQLFRQGTDLNDNGKLDVLSNEPITEQLSSCEQSGGYWWQVNRSREYFEDGGSRTKEHESRTRLGAGPAAYTQSIQRPGVTTTTSTTLSPSTRTRTTTTTRSDSTNAAAVTEINGMQVYRKDFLEAGGSFANNSTQYFYDALRRPVKVQYPNSTMIVTTTYDAFDRVATVKDGTTSSPGTGLLVNDTFDYYPASYGLSEGRLYSKKQIPGGGSGVLPQYTYFAYNSQGQQTHTWGPGTYPTKQVYDAYGQRTQLHTYRATSGSFVGDPAYNAPPTGFSLSTPDVTTWTYDAGTGVQTSKKDAANEEVLYSYNADGSLHQRTWARGAITTYSYDSLGRVMGLSYSDSTPPVTHTYHRDGTRRTTTDAAGLLTQSLDPATGSISREAVTTAEGSSNLLSGSVLDRSYDGVGRIAGLQARNTGGLGPVGPLAPGISITYATAHGRVGSISSGGQTATYAYSNPLGLPRTWITRSSGSDSMDYVHPILGRRTQGSVGTSEWTRQWLVNPGNGVTIAGKNPDTEQLSSTDPLWTYGMNTRGEVTSASRSQGLPVGERGELMQVGLEGWTATYSYDALGNRYSTNYGYSSSESGSVAYTTNALNQYTELANSRRMFVLGSAQNTATVKVNGVTAVNQPTVDYNVPIRQYTQFAGRLTVPGTDAAWVPVSVEASTASPAVSITQTGNRYHPPATETMTYDEDGNLTGDGRWVYTWDAENRLVGLATQTSAVTAGVPNLKLTFAYDARHRRIRKKTEIYDVPTTSWVTLTDTRFIYDGWNLLVEVEMHTGAKDAPAGASGPFVSRSYVWGTDISDSWQGAGGVSGLLAVRRHERGTKPISFHWTAWDLTGNILGLSGGSAAMYEYDPFGRLLRESEIEEALNPFRFSTKYTDAETGFAYYGYRFYDAMRGRWINRDPIEEEGGTNLYALGANGVTVGYDVLGMKWTKEDEDRWHPDTPLTYAGSEMRSALDATLAEVESVFSGWDTTTKDCQCRALFSIRTFIEDPNFWDIPTLRTGWPSSEDAGKGAWVKVTTVYKQLDPVHLATFGGRVYPVYVMNYALYGKIWAVCNKEFPNGFTRDGLPQYRYKYSKGDMMATVYEYKAIQHAIDGLAQPFGWLYPGAPIMMQASVDWAVYGYDGTHPGESGEIETAIPSEKVYANPTMKWRWRPKKQ